MIKKTKLNQRKMVLLALASVALLTPVVRGQTITPNMGDAILGFRATAAGSQGQTANLEVDLGPVSQFYGLTPGDTIALSPLSVQDISATYGANWITRDDLYWGVIATAGRASAYSNGVVNVPVGTLWASAPNCATAWNRGSAPAQKNASATLEAVFTPGGLGSLYGATHTANSASAAVISDTLAGSWGIEDEKIAGTSFGYFNPTIDNYEGTNIVASQLFELQPVASGSAPGHYLGDFVMTAAGLSFRAASPLTAVCSNGVVLQVGGNCTATLTAADVDGGSMGYCLSLSVEPTGPLSVGETNVTLTATDGFGNTNSCTTTVSIVAGAPTVSCPANISQNVDAGQCYATVTYTTPTGNGCATPINVVCSPVSGSHFDVGTNTVTCTATDASSNTGTCSFKVIVASTTAPTLSSTSNISQVAAAGQCSAVVSYTTPTATGCNTPINVVCVPASGSTFSVGSTNVTCTATDAASRTGTSSFSVTVTSTTAPTLSSTSSISQNVDAGQCYATVTYTTPTATGCNTPIGVVCVPASGSHFSVGTTNVTCTATDAASRTGTSSFSVTVSAPAPTVTSPANIVTNVLSSSATNMVITFTTPTATGCATPINVVCSPASGSTFNVGTTPVTCTATDAASKTGTSSFSVIVNGAGISGISGQVTAISNAVNVVTIGHRAVTNTLTTVRLNALLSSLNLAGTDLAAEVPLLTKEATDLAKHSRIGTNQAAVVGREVAGKVLEACGQLNGFITKVKVYEEVGILSSNNATALINSANAEKAALGCE